MSGAEIDRHRWVGPAAVMPTGGDPGAASSEDDWAFVACCAGCSGADPHQLSSGTQPPDGESRGSPAGPLVASAGRRNARTRACARVASSGAGDRRR